MTDINEQTEETRLALAHIRKKRDELRQVMEEMRPTGDGSDALSVSFLGLSADRWAMAWEVWAHGDRDSLDGYFANAIERARDYTRRIVTTPTPEHVAATQAMIAAIEATSAECSPAHAERLRAAWAGVNAPR